jgi:hypothetical protein
LVKAEPRPIEECSGIHNLTRFSNDCDLAMFSGPVLRRGFPAPKGTKSSYELSPDSDPRALSWVRNSEINSAFWGNSLQSRILWAFSCNLQELTVNNSE